jgi:hypothetical protein
MHLRSVAFAAGCTLFTSLSFAQPNGQMGDMKMDQPATKVISSPPANANVILNDKPVVIRYNSPRMQGRKIMGSLVPYSQVWRTGANAATTLITATSLKIGTLNVPAGTYTIYTLPNADQWLLILNEQTGQWGTEYVQAQDLGRTPMQNKTLPAPQENMSISFEHTQGSSTELHVKWETTDEYVIVQAQ